MFPIYRASAEGTANRLRRYSLNLTKHVLKKKSFSRITDSTFKRFIYMTHKMIHN